MGSKIKWNDDRLQATTTALLLISRELLARGDTDNLIEAALVRYRNDPEGYKEDKAGWPDVKEAGALKKPWQVEYYKKLSAAVDALVKKMVQGKRQFSSVTELDNFLVFNLSKVS